jgi:hypothetical protein
MTGYGIQIKEENERKPRRIRKIETNRNVYHSEEEEKTSDGIIPREVLLRYQTSSDMTPSIKPLISPTGFSLIYVKNPSTNHTQRHMHTGKTNGRQRSKKVFKKTK